MDPDFALFLDRYGYGATLVGTMVEGESFLVLSGLAAQHGYLSLPLLIAAGAIGAFASDNLFFAMGRKLGPTILARFPFLASAVARAHLLAQRLPNTAVIGVRFLYGMRTVGPAVLGTGDMSWARFAMLDAIAALLWSSCWVFAGYAMGTAIAIVLTRITRDGTGWLYLVTATMAIIGLIVLHRWSKRRGLPKSRIR